MSERLLLGLVVLLALGVGADAADEATGNPASQPAAASSTTTPAANPGDPARSIAPAEVQSAGTADASPPATGSEAAKTDPQTAGTAASAQPSSTGTATAASTPAQTPPAKEESTSLEPAPGESGPDPLTPAATDTGPALAPGAPVHAADAQTKPAASLSPMILAIRQALEARAEPSDAATKADLAALKSYFGRDDAIALWVDGPGFSGRANSAISVLKRADEFGLDAGAFPIPSAPAQSASDAERAATEIELALSVLKYARHARGGRIDPPSLSAMIDLRPRLYEPTSLIEAVAAAPSAEAYLEGLHPPHEGFRSLRKALLALRQKENGASEAKPNEKAGRTSHDERRIVANMERWRWLPDDLGEFYIWDNVPEQITRAVHDGKIVLKERIVVGKPKTPTPMFSAPMRFVIFHPSWGVPEGIKKNELGPMLRRAQNNSSGWFFGPSDGASRALRRHELRVYRGGREVNPDSINWSSVDVRQFQFSQPPSSKNVLGIVKFRFPNKYDVYMHDTSERHLFSRAPRTFSHGCMRVQNPLKLAEVILSYDKGWGRDRIASLAARNSTAEITLEKKVPVYIVYFTATVDENDKLVTLPDIYGIDSRVASALAGRSVTLSSASPPPASEASQRRTRRVQRSRPAQSTASPARPRSNPFANAAQNSP